MWSVIGGTTWPNCYLAIACFLYASEEEYVVDSWWFEIHVWIYISHLIFSVGLALDWNTLMVNCRLAWNLLFHGCIQNGRGGGTRPFIHFCFLLSFSCIVCLWSQNCVVLYDQKKLYCTFVWLWYKLSYSYQKFCISLLWCIFAKIKYKRVYSCICMKFFF